MVGTQQVGGTLVVVGLGLEHSLVGLGLEHALVGLRDKEVVACFLGLVAQRQHHEVSLELVRVLGERSCHLCLEVPNLEEQWNLMV